MNCKDCIYSKKSFEVANNLICYFNPPIPFGFIIPGQGVAAQSLRPIVSPGDFCSNYDPKTIEQAAHSPNAFKLRNE